MYCFSKKFSQEDLAWIKKIIKDNFTLLIKLFLKLIFTLFININKIKKKYLIKKSTLRRY